MPCPDFDVSIVKRSDNRSAVASAAYQSGNRLFSDYDHKWKDYTGKHEIVHEEILLPANALPEYADRQTLWNAVEDVERNWNFQLARKFRMAIPREIPANQYVELVRKYCKEQFVSKGMICDFAIHDKGDGNPHAHIQLTLRSLDENGKWNPKSRKVYVLNENGERIRLPSGAWKSRKEDVVDWNDRRYCEVWRTAWADIQNEYLERNNRPERVDLRSYERQGIVQVPMVHMGPSVAAMERKGVATNIGNLNRDIQKHNSLMAQIRKAVRKLTEWIADLSEKRKIILEILQERAEPTLVELLSDYMEMRSQERATWSARSRLKGTVSDFEKIKTAVNYLEEHGIQTVDDLKALLDEVGGMVSKLRSGIRNNEKRIKEIGTTLGCYKTYRRLAPVNAEYQKKNFKMSRERFYVAHKDELDEFQEAYRYLMKHGGIKEGNRLKIDSEKFTREQTRLKAENAEINARIDAVVDDLEMLKTIRYYVSKVQPEPEEVAQIVKSDPEKKKSIRQELKNRLERIAAEQDGSPQRTKNKNRDAER